MLAKSIEQGLQIPGGATGSPVEEAPDFAPLGGVEKIVGRAAFPNNPVSPPRNFFPEASCP